MEAEKIIQIMRDSGLRITAQRKLIIETLLENECSCCKELFYHVRKKDASIGVATVYRMVKTLEELGIVDRKLVCWADKL